METRTRSTATISVLLATAGALQLAAAWQRWWPACRWGAFDAPACLRRQSHTYDFVFPSDPWVPAGQAATLAGLSMLLLGVAVASLPLMLRVGHRPVHVWLLCVTLGWSEALAGVSTLESGLLGRAVYDAWTPFAVFVWLVWPVALTGTALLMVGHVRRPGAGWVLFVVLLSASTPLGQAFGAPVATNYLSYDTTPWTEAWGGACLLLASLAVWPAAYRRPRRVRIAVDRPITLVRVPATARSAR